LTGAVLTAGLLLLGAGAVASAHGGPHHGRRGGPSGRASAVCRQLHAGHTTTGVLATLSSAQLTQLTLDCATLAAAETTAQTTAHAVGATLRLALASARSLARAACVPASTSGPSGASGPSRWTGASGTSGWTGASGASGWTGPSAACRAALLAGRKAEHAAERTYLQALAIAAIPVDTAARAVTTDLAADRQADGATSPSGPTGNTDQIYPHAHHRGRGHFGATGPSGASGASGSSSAPWHSGGRS
jgi:hypothetical protein